MSASAGVDLARAVTAELLALAELLDELAEADWDTPSLCGGWRVREVVAHLTMPVRYSPEAFQAELRECGGDFTRLSNRLAFRDASLSTDELVGNLRHEVMHRWVPPGRGPIGALNHVVIHGLDIRVPLDRCQELPEETIRAVLDDLTEGGTHTNFGVPLAGVSLHATDLDWSFGSGTPVTGSATDIALLLSGRARPGHPPGFDRPLGPER